MSTSMRLNPHIQYYSTVYVISMGAALLLKTVRGLVFVKVSIFPLLALSFFPPNGPQSDTKIRYIISALQLSAAP